MVKSTPLLKKRIVKKRTLKFTRFQSDLYGGRLAESWRRPRGNSTIIQALIIACVEDLEATRKCPKSDMDQTIQPSTFCPTVLKNLL
jgi:ribosomal protein L32E